MLDPHPSREVGSAPGNTERPRAEERRTHSSWSLIHGHFLRRRKRPRRSEDRNRFVADLHHPGLLVVAVIILLLSAADAYLTMHLLNHGAKELNWFMAQLVHLSPQKFVALKMALSGLGVIVLVTRRHALLFGRVSVEAILYGVLFGYCALICYELTLLMR
jgi:hypothetical protein